MSQNEQLLKTFNATPEDLLANQVGRLGAGQARQLRTNAWISVIQSEIFIGCFIGIVYISSNGTPELSQHIVAGILVLIGAFVLYRTVRQPFAATRAGIVECVTGPVVVEPPNGTQWRLTVQERSFLLPGKSSSITTNKTYRVYVAPAVNRVVAMEPLV